MGIINGLHHVKLKVTKDSFEDVLKFYVGVLGLEVLSRHEDCAILDTGCGILEVFNDGEKLLGTGDFRHIAFAVDDADLAIKTVEEAGYKITEYPINVIFGLREPTPARIAFCEGPVGEEIEFFQIRNEE